MFVCESVCWQRVLSMLGRALGARRALQMQMQIESASASASACVGVRRCWAECTLSAPERMRQVSQFALANSLHLVASHCSPVCPGFSGGRQTRMGLALFTAERPDGRWGACGATSDDSCL